MTQEVDMTRNLTLSITPEKIKDIQNYASNHTADETLAYIRNNYAVTGDTGWKINNAINTKTSYDAVTSPTIAGYTAEIQSTNANGVTTGANASEVHAILDIPESIVKNGQLTEAYKNNGTTGIPANYETVVVYKKVVEKQTLTYTVIDENDPNNPITLVNAEELAQGDSESALPSDVTTKYQAIQDAYKAKGYIVKSADALPTNFDNDSSKDQNVVIRLTHDTVPVTPNNPQTPGDPINPNDPEGPKWPDEAGEDAVKKPVKATVNYTGAPENPTPNVQNANLTKTVTIDKVTGKVISETPWTPDKDNYDPVKTPVVDGYYADTAEVPGQPVTENDITTTVTYKPLGKIVPKDKDSNEIPGADQPQYNNDPNDPTKGGETPVPTVPGYHLEDPSKTTVTPDPEDPGKDTPVVYEKNEDPKKPDISNERDQNAKIIFRDVTTDTDLATEKFTGKSGSKITYSTADKIKELLAKGYVLVNDGFSSDAAFDSDNDVDQTYYVTFKHGEAPVGPNDPHEPGTPINPNDPNGPKWPAKDEYTKEFTSTVHFVDKDGNKLRDDDVQTSTWTRTLIVDTVTGKVKNPDAAWTSDKGNYNDVKVPVIEGYYADKANVPGPKATQENIETNVVYNEIGKIVPVDPEGNPIPGVPTPQYKNDPNDPTKVVVTDTPDVPGYTTDTVSMTPNIPGEDTPVVYNKVETPKDPEKTPGRPSTPAPAPTTPEAKPQPAAKEQPKADKPAAELPQMGDADNNSIAALGVVMITSLLGLFGFASKKKKDEENI